MVVWQPNPGTKDIWDWAMMGITVMTGGVTIRSRTRGHKKRISRVAPGIAPLLSRSTTKFTRDWDLPKLFSATCGNMILLLIHGRGKRTWRAERVMPQPQLHRGIRHMQGLEWLAGTGLFSTIGGNMILLLIHGRGKRTWR